MYKTTMKPTNIYVGKFMNNNKGKLVRKPPRKPCKNGKVLEIIDDPEKED